MHGRGWGQVPKARGSVLVQSPLLRRLGLMLCVLVLAGYPAISMVPVFTGVSISIPYRAFVLALALVIMIMALPKGRGASLDTMLAFFLFLYGFRLGYDWLNTDISGTDRESDSSRPSSSRQLSLRCGSVSQKTCRSLSGRSELRAWC